MFRFLSVLSLFVFANPLSAQDANPDAIYHLGPDSQRHDGCPKGEVTRFEFRSEIFEGTLREYYVYVPQQYDGQQPACLMVFQDGHAYVKENGELRVPVVFDNLIHSGELPVTICVFVNPGHLGETMPDNRWKSSNRSFEYDTLSDQYARFINNELVPHVERSMRLSISSDPADRAICGASSGGICAFTAAWNHPEWFGKVLSHIGSFTNIRGGHVYPALIRKTARKPIRVYLQDGENDLDNQHGNWWLSNLQMEKSLAFKDYDYQFVAGQGKHSQKHGGAILPDSLRWLWRDHVAGKDQVSESQPKIWNDDEYQMALSQYEVKSIDYTGGEYNNETFQYRLLKPDNIEEGQSYPLLIFLHGAGERGNDNEIQLKYLPTLMATERYRKRFPCYVLAPQCRKDRKWVEVDWSQSLTHQTPEDPGDQSKAFQQMLSKTLAEEKIDASRVYLTGLSMGGYGSWDLSVRLKNTFAAVAPICGGADNSAVTALATTPVWVAHGDKDGAVPVERSRLAVQTLQKVGGNVTYVEYPGVGHDSWTAAYTDNDGLIPWLFRQQKSVSADR